MADDENIVHPHQLHMLDLITIHPMAQPSCLTPEASQGTACIPFQCMAIHGMLSSWLALQERALLERLTGSTPTVTAADMEAAKHDGKTRKNKSKAHLKRKAKQQAEQAEKNAKRPKKNKDKYDPIKRKAMAAQKR